MMRWADSKAPADVLDFYFDWSGAIEPVDGLGVNEAVVSCVAVVASGTVQIQSQLLVGAMLQVTIAGGAVGELATLTSTLVTSKGRTLVWTVGLQVRDR